MLHVLIQRIPALVDLQKKTNAEVFTFVSIEFKVVILAHKISTELKNATIKGPLRIAFFFARL